MSEVPEYYADGYCRNSKGDLGTDKLFTGQRLDDTGLYYYGARYYDPTIGRFISPDTLVQNPANPQAFNRYSYVLNNPLRYVDPSGLNVMIGDTDISSVDEIVDQIIQYVEGGVEPPAYLIEQLLEATSGLEESDYDTWNDWERYARENPEIAGMLEESESVFTFNGVIPGQSGRSVLETIGQEIFDAIGYERAYATTLHGVKLATMAGSANLSFGPGGTLVFENIERMSITGIMMETVLGGTPAFTMGYAIITAAPQIDPYLEHELGHVTQSAILGSAYLPSYVIGWALGKGKHDLNPMESWLLPNWPRR